MLDPGSGEALVPQIRGGMGVLVPLLGSPPKVRTTTTVVGIWLTPAVGVTSQKEKDNEGE